MKKLIYIIFLLLLFNEATKGQEMSLYTPDFKFQEGVYLSYRDFKENNPSIKSQDLLDKRGQFLKIEKNDVLFGKLKEIYYSNRGVLAEIKSSEIWGFCIDGVPYIKYTGKNRFAFYKIYSVGSLSRFFVLKYRGETMRKWVPQTMAPAVYVLNNGVLPNALDPTGNIRSSGKLKSYEFVIDYKTGNVLSTQYEKNLIIEIIKSDEKFNNIKIKKRDLGIYITQYNKNNVVSFPEYLDQ